MLHMSLSTVQTASSKNDGGNIGIKDDDDDDDDDDNVGEDLNDDGASATEVVMPALMMAVILRCTSPSSAFCSEFNSVIVLTISAIPPPRSIIRRNVSIYIQTGKKRRKKRVRKDGGKCCDSREWGKKGSSPAGGLVLPTITYRCPENTEASPSTRLRLR